MRGNCLASSPSGHPLVRRFRSFRVLTRAAQGLILDIEMNGKSCLLLRRGNAIVRSDRAAVVARLPIGAPAFPLSCRRAVP
jgi:hypothetical protein